MIDIATAIAAHGLLIIITLILSALPLYFSVKVVKGEAGIVKIILIGLILAFASLGAARFIGVFAGIFMLFATLFVYKMGFKISIFKAFIAWILQYIFIFITLFVVILLLELAP